MQPQTFVFFGIIGSGKGTQVEFLKNFLSEQKNQECVYAGTGEGFRSLVGSGNYAGELLKDKMNKGELIDDFFANSIIANVLSSQLDSTKNLILDGYPRTVAQAEVFETMMKFYQRDIINIIYIEISEEESIKRNLKRGRSDDTKEGIEKRIEEFNKKVIPSMNYFKNKNNYRFHVINGEQSREDVFKDIIKALNL